MVDKFSLRPLGFDDIDDEYCAWYENLDGHLDYFTGSGRNFDINVLVEDYRKGIQTGIWYYYIIEDVATHQKIGNVKIGPIDKKNKTSDLVCLIGNRSFVGKGLASEIISTATKIAFDEFDIRRLHGGIYSKNIASIKAYVRAGWEIEATMRGYYLHDGIQIDRVCVCCLNPRYFPEGKK